MRYFRFLPCFQRLVCSTLPALSGLLWLVATVLGSPALESVSVSTYNTVTSVSELVGYFVLCLFCEACWARKHLGTWMKSIPERGPRADSCKSQHLR